MTTELAAQALAVACLAVAAAIDVRTRRIPNALVLAALVLAVAARPEPSTFGGALLAPLPLLALAAARLAGMGAAKIAAPIGALLGLATVPSRWAWALLGAAVTLTASGVRGRRATEAPPLAPALLVAWAVLAAMG